VNNFRNIACLVVHNSVDVYYSFACYHCSNCFWCIGLRNKQYCILNKQYEKADYETLVPKIIQHMETHWERGEFFNPSLSPFGYNETVALDYYPSTAEQVKQQGFNWSAYEAPAPTADTTIQGKDLPATIDEVGDDILQTIIVCEVSGKLFKIQPKELEFYRKHRLPLPRRHPDQRHLERTILKVPENVR
jgi:hypothetical protein